MKRSKRKGRVVNCREVAEGIGIDGLEKIIDMFMYHEDSLISPEFQTNTIFIVDKIEVALDICDFISREVKKERKKLDIEFGKCTFCHRTEEEAWDVRCPKCFKN